jgi:hypothetical protein
VNLVDPSGHDPEWLECILVASLAIGTIALTIASCGAASAAIAPYAFIYFGMAANTTLAITTAAVATTSIGIAAFAIADIQSIITEGESNYLSFLGDSYDSVKGTFYFAAYLIGYTSQFAVPGWGKQTYGKDDAPQYGDKYGAYHMKNSSLTIYDGRGYSIARYDFGHAHNGMQPHVHYFNWWFYDGKWRWDGKTGTVKPYY